MKTMQEILNLMIDEGFYSDTERGGGSSYMCHALRNAELKGLITEKEYTDCTKKIKHYLDIELGSISDYLTDSLRDVGLPYDKEYITALYRNWENRPIPATRPVSEILKTVVDKGFLSKDEYSSGIYRDLFRASMGKVITEKERRIAVAAVLDYMKTIAGSLKLSLAEALEKAGLPYTDKDVLETCTNWENRPMPTRSRKEALTKQLEEVLNTAEEIKTELQNIEIDLFETGQRVYSPIFGEGVVTEVTAFGDYPISVKFDATGSITIFTRRGLNYKDDLAPTIYPYPVKIVPSEEVAEEESDDVNFEVGDEVYCTVAGKAWVVRVDRNK